MSYSQEFVPSPGSDDDAMDIDIVDNVGNADAFAGAMETHEHIVSALIPTHYRSPPTHIPAETGIRVFGDAREYPADEEIDVIFVHYQIIASLRGLHADDNGFECRAPFKSVRSVAVAVAAAAGPATDLSALDPGTLVLAPTAQNRAVVLSAFHRLLVAKARRCRLYAARNPYVQLLETPRRNPAYETREFLALARAARPRAAPLDAYAVVARVPGERGVRVEPVRSALVLAKKSAADGAVAYFNSALGCAVERPGEDDVVVWECEVAFHLFWKWHNELNGRSADMSSIQGQVDALARQLSNAHI